MLFGFVLVSCVWGSTFLGIRIAVETIPPFFMSGTRFFTAGVIMMILSLAMGRRLPKNWFEWRTALIMGLLLLALGNGLVSYAEVFVPSNQAALLVSTSALWIAWMGTLGAQGQALSRRASFGLVVGVMGVACLFWPGGTLESEFFGAQLLLLFASVSWSAGTIYFRNQDKSLDPFMFAGSQMLCGGIMLIVASLVLGEFEHIQFTSRTFSAWSYLVVFGSCLAFACYVWLIDRIKSASLAMISYITPVIATLLGWLVLDETLSQVQLIGMIVIVTAIVLVTLPKRPVPTQ